MPARRGSAEIETALSPQTFAPLNADMLERIREKDWSQTPLGPRPAWSESLRASVDMILASPNGMILLWGPEFVQIYNDGYRDVMGHRHPSGLGQPNKECWPEVWHFNKPIYERVLNGGTVNFHEQHLVLERHGAPEDAWFDLCYSPLVRVDGAVMGILASVVERTDRILAERALRASERRLAVAIEASAGGVFEHHVPPGEELHLSARWCSILGYQRAPVPPQEFEAWLDAQIHPEDRSTRRQEFAGFLQGSAPRHEAEIRLRHATGGWVWVREFADAVERDGSGRVTHLSGMILDITQRKRAEDEAQRLAHHDPLTGLPNRALFHVRLEQAIERSERESSCIGLVLVDLNRFKAVNDTMGHPAGDALLQIAARRLSNAVRSGDTVARLGGDEFALVLPSASSRQSVEELARRVCRTMVQPAVIEGQTVELTGSFGVATYPEDGKDHERLMHHADLALYKAKSSSREHLRMFHEGMATEASERTRTETELRRAISEEILDLHYQPQLDLQTGRIRGVEALLRWPRDGNGYLPSAEFIELAETSGLIRRLGPWVLEKACAELKKWHAAGRDLTVAVNISPAEVNTEGFPGRLERIVTTSGIDPRMLELEITETLVVDYDQPAVHKLFRVCGELGIRLAIDDFGVAYSSLSYLSRLPISRIKIDRSFVSNIGRRADDMLIEGIVDLAHRLDKRVTAEGVERESQLEFLRGIGCDDVQGFLLHKPCEAAEIDVLLASAELHSAGGPLGAGDRAAGVAADEEPPEGQCAARARGGS